MWFTVIIDLILDCIGGSYGTKSNAPGQEEDLCRCTTLYFLLRRSQERKDGYYVGENEPSNDKLLYISNVSVTKKPDESPIKKADQFTVDIIVCAAPNRNSKKRNDGFTEEEVEAALYNRIERILFRAAQNKDTCLILGAWGCGAFANNPRQVADIFRECIYKKVPNYFPMIIFALGNIESNHDGGFYSIASGKTAVPVIPRVTLISQEVLKYGSKMTTNMEFCNNHGKIEIDEYKYKSVEHYYQCAKFKDRDYDEVWLRVKNSDDALKYYNKKVAPAYKKQYCYSVEIWKKYMSMNVMYIALMAKFEQTKYKNILLATGDAYLQFEEADDEFWAGTGNTHGRMLMMIRKMSGSGKVAGKRTNTVADPPAIQVPLPTYFKTDKELKGKNLYHWDHFMKRHNVLSNAWYEDKPKSYVDWNNTIEKYKDQCVILQTPEWRNLSLDMDCPMTDADGNLWRSSKHYFYASQYKKGSVYEYQKKTKSKFAAVVDNDNYYAKFINTFASADILETDIVKDNITAYKGFHGLQGNSASPKFDAMYTALALKIGYGIAADERSEKQNEMNTLLHTTKNRIIINLDDDEFWGISKKPHKGCNYAGRMLMILRDANPLPPQSITAKSASPKVDLQYLTTDQSSWGGTAWTVFLKLKDVQETLMLIKSQHIIDCIEHKHYDNKDTFDYVDWLHIDSKFAYKFYNKDEDSYYLTNLYQLRDKITDQHRETWNSSEIYYQAHKYRRLTIDNPEEKYAYKHNNTACDNNIPYKEILNSYKAYDNADRAPFNVNKALVRKSYMPYRGFYAGDNFKIMWNILKLKFGVHAAVTLYSDEIQELRAKIAKIDKNLILIEDAGRNDKFWGNGEAPNSGANYLGRMLMLIRALAQRAEDV